MDDYLVIEHVYDLKRELLNLRSAALPVRDICGELMRFHEEIIPNALRFASDFAIAPFPNFGSKVGSAPAA